MAKRIRTVPNILRSIRDGNIIKEIRNAVESGQFTRITIVFGENHYTDHQEYPLLLLKRHYETRK